MPRGGPRSGAGRKPGSINRRTREIAERAAREGISPLEVMLGAMRQHVANGDWDRAAEIARHAAPYCHPRFATVQVEFPACHSDDERKAEAEIAIAQANVTPLLEYHQWLNSGLPPEQWPEQVRADFPEIHLLAAPDPSPKTRSACVALPLHWPIDGSI